MLDARCWIRDIEIPILIRVLVSAGGFNIQQPTFNIQHSSYETATSLHHAFIRGVLGGGKGPNANF